MNSSSQHPTLDLLQLSDFHVSASPWITLWKPNKEPTEDEQWCDDSDKNKMF